MKPQQPDIEYCIKNAEFVNGLLEKRGGLGFGDKVWIRREGKVAIIQRFYVFTDH